MYYSNVLCLTFLLTDLRLPPRPHTLHELVNHLEPNSLCLTFLLKDLLLPRRLRDAFTVASNGLISYRLLSQQDAYFGLVCRPPPVPPLQEVSLSSARQE